jgi:hypothetical protein
VLCLWRTESPNTEKTFKSINGKAAYWDYHVWADDKNAGIAVDTNLTRMQQLFHQWDPNTTMKWRDIGREWRTA